MLRTASAREMMYEQKRWVCYTCRLLMRVLFGQVEGGFAHHTTVFVERLFPSLRLLDSPLHIQTLYEALITLIPSLRFKQSNSYSFSVWHNTPKQLYAAEAITFGRAACPAFSWHFLAYSSRLCPPALNYQSILTIHLNSRLTRS